MTDVTERSELISVVVPVYNKADVLRECLNSIVAAARQDSDTELVLVDHGSSDGSYEILLEYAHVATIQRFHGGTIAAVRNVGARVARGEILSFIDCDCVARPEYFGELRRILLASDVAATGCECDIPSPAHWTERIWHALHAPEGDGFCQYVNAANFAIRRGAFDEIGGFDERLLTGEDTDICRRLCAAGYGIYEARGVGVVHLANPKSVAAFFHKQKWHGASVLQGSSLRAHKATLMVFAHLGSLALAAAVLAVPLLSVPQRIALAIAFAMAVPAVTVVYRFIETKRIVNPMAALLLYVVFYFARATAVLSSLRQRGSGVIAGTPGT